MWVVVQWRAAANSDLSNAGSCSDCSRAPTPGRPLSARGAELQSVGCGSLTPSCVHAQKRRLFPTLTAWIQASVMLPAKGAVPPRLEPVWQNFGRGCMPPSLC